MDHHEIGIKYFATNRSMENLGRDYARRERRQLRSSGYYWVDMVAYMGHYLGTVESDTLDRRNIEKNANQKVFDRFLAKPSVGRVVVCVHGFNVNLNDAYTWFRILVNSMRRTSRDQDDDLGRSYSDLIVTHPGRPEEQARLERSPPNSLTAFVGYSWPSNGNVFSYPSDQREAVGSASALANLIARIHSYDKHVSLICHSMGNYLACNMFAGLANQDFVPRIFQLDDASLEDLDETRRGHVKKWRNTILQLHADKATEEAAPNFVDRYVMLAPDVERRHVTKCVANAELVDTEDEKADYIGPFYEGLRYLTSEIYNFYSRFDGALSISNVEKAPRQAAVAASGFLDTVTMGVFDFLERNPDEKWEMRLGSAPHPPNAPRNFQSYNATEISGREIGHSDYIDSREIAAKIARILVEPSER